MTTASSAARRPSLGGDNALELAILEARGLSFSYGERRALDGVSFSIARGEIFGFLGPNGGGKTTLFKVLSTLVPAQEGTVRIFGHDLSANPEAVRQRLGVVFQHPGLDGKLTALENLMHHGHLYGLAGNKLREASHAMLERLGLAERADDLVETLSGGLRRRTELAKALLHEPQLLLLDEPSTGLDPGARREFGEHLAQLRERNGVSVALTTHYIEEAERCDRIAILDRGQLIASGPPSQLKDSIGGDVVVIHTREPQSLAPKLSARIGVKSSVVDSAIRIEHPRGHELVKRIVEEFDGEIESVTFGKPTLEDVFIRLTGHRFFASAEESTG